MLPTNLLQSQLAHNKKRINELQSLVQEYLYDIKSVNEQIKPHVGDVLALQYLDNLVYEKMMYIKDLQKTRKQLKQLAILQKSIKQEIAYSHFYHEVMFGGE